MSDPPVPAAVQHVCSSSSMFCRMMEEGLSKPVALAWAKRIEAALNPIIYGAGDDTIISLEELDQ